MKKFSIFGKEINLFTSKHDIYCTGSIEAGFTKMIDESVEISDIDSINIKWMSGRVNLESREGDTLCFSESSESANAFAESERLVYKIEEKTLFICFLEEKSTAGRDYDFQKKLTVLVPVGWKGEKVCLSAVSACISVNNINSKISEIKAVSGNIAACHGKSEQLMVSAVSGTAEVSDYTADIAEIKSVSGDVNASHIQVGGTLKAHSVSGTVKGADLIADSINASSTSGSVYLREISSSVTTLKLTSGNGMLDFANAPKVIDAKSVSAGLEIFLPEIGGFTVSLSSVSGKIVTDYAGQLIGSESFKYGDGNTRISMRSVNGNIFINERAKI